MSEVYTAERTVTHKIKCSHGVSDDSDTKRKVPSQIERGHISQSHSPHQEQSDSEEGQSDTSSSSQEDSEAEKSDGDDDLEAMEKNPQALEKTFAEEVSIALVSTRCLQRSARLILFHSDRLLD